MTTNRVSIEEMTEEALECRADRHWWKHVTDTELIKSEGKIVQFKRLSECRRCGAERSQTIACPSFVVVSASTHYPKGYLHDGGRLPVAEVRREHYSRIGFKF